MTAQNGSVSALPNPNNNHDPDTVPRDYAPQETKSTEQQQQPKVFRIKKRERSKEENIVPALQPSSQLLPSAIARKSLGRSLSTSQMRNVNQENKMMSIISERKLKESGDLLNSDDQCTQNSATAAEPVVVSPLLPPSPSPPLVDFPLKQSQLEPKSRSTSLSSDYAVQNSPVQTTCSEDDSERKKALMEV